MGSIKVLFEKKKVFNLIVKVFLIAYLIRALFIQVPDNLGLLDNNIVLLRKLVLLVFEITFLFCALLYFKTYKSILLFCLGIVLIGIVSPFCQIHFNESIEYSLWSSLISGNLFYLAHLIFPLLFFVVLQNCSFPKNFFVKTFKIIEWILLFNCLFIILGLLFELSVFQSYAGDRFGYSGLFPRKLIVSVSVIIVFNRFLKNHFDLKLLLIVGGGALTGMKVFYLFMCVMALCFLAKTLKRRYAYIILTVIMICLIFNIDNISRLFVAVFPFFEPILESSGGITVLLSYRDENLLGLIDFLKLNGTFITFLFGGVNIDLFWVEIDYIDLFMLYGLVGGIFYLSILKKIIKPYSLWVPFLVLATGGIMISNIIAGCLIVLLAKKSVCVDKT